ncbi:MAG: nicotinate phosphoribosyltransferase [Elainellaceae cyanobacterium]
MTTTLSRPMLDSQDLNLTAADASLLTDLYQLTMAACYVGEGLDQRPAYFELFVRKLPSDFGYLIAAGLEQALDYLQQLRFSPDQIQSLRATGLFDHVPQSFWTVLEHGRFEGTVWAVPEGTAIFANEPLLRIEAPLWQAQIAESYLLNTINYQTLIATRAARMRDVAGDEANLLEFGTRRAFSPQGSMWAARAAIAGGFDATSNVLAALKLGQKPSGTMAHSLVMALSALEGREDEAFTAFHRYFPDAALLIDTFDTVAAAQRLAQQVEAGERSVRAIRIDSGDLVSLSQQVRSLLPDTLIFASGDLDEYEITRLKQEGATIDGYGIGTKLVTGAPVNGVYKLVEIDSQPVMKVASGKVTYPGRKQIMRQWDESGQWKGDRLCLIDEMNADREPAPPDSQGSLKSVPLLQPVMEDGHRLQEPEKLGAIAQRTRVSVQSLPSDLRQIDQPPTAPIEISDALQQLTQRTQQQIQSHYTKSN